MTEKMDLSRRTVLKTMLWTPPAIMFASGYDLFGSQEITPLYQPRMVPKGEKIRAVQIGVFNRGSQVLKSFSGNSSQIEFQAFADVLFTSHNYQMKDFPGIPCYRDYRQMFEEMHDQFDAVIVATPDHSHFPMVMHAMLLGKHNLLTHYQYL